MALIIHAGIAPTLFGYIATQVMGGGTLGLQRTFLLMAIPLVVSGVLGLIAFRTYPRDVATAEAHTQRTEERGDHPRSNPHSHRGRR